MSNIARVGIFATLALVVLGYLIFKVEDLRLFGDEGERVEAVFESVAGLDDKAAIRVAGVRVGRVDGIRLQDRQAIVGLLLETPVHLTEGATAIISSLGLLGDKFIELDPGDPTAPALQPGATLQGRTPPGWDQAVAKFSDLGSTLQQTLASVDARSLSETTHRLLINLEATSADIRDLMKNQRGTIDSTIANFGRVSSSLADELPKLTRQIERVLEQVELVVAENRGSLGDSLDHIAEVSGAMKVSIGHLNEITERVAAGEGTLGKLVSSDEMHDGLTSTLTSVQSGIDSLTQTLGKVQKLGLDLSIDTYALDQPSDTRTAFNITLEPGETNRFYRLGVVDDPRGQLTERSETVTVEGPDGLPETTITTTRFVDHDLTFSAQFGFRFGNAQLRTGVFESTGGAAVDYSLFDKRLWVSLEGFEFGREDDLSPHLRFTGKWRLHPNVYLLGGLDDFLESERETFFLGAGIRWSDDDLKYLLGSLPSGF